MNRVLHLVVAVLLLASFPSFAIDAIDFASEEERLRYQRLTYELRCPRCQNQNLIDSDSQISEDLRREVARLIGEGKSDKEIKDHMVSLYGDFVLYKPPVQPNTIALWAGPFVMLGIGLLIFSVIVIKRSRIKDTEDIDELS